MRERWCQQEGKPITIPRQLRNKPESNIFERMGWRHEPLSVAGILAIAYI